VLVNASAVGYYGPRGAEELDESSAAGADLMARVCQDWEAAARPAEAGGVRVVLLRTGLVLDKRGGALEALLPPFKFFVGGPVGLALNPSEWGKQYWSWVYHADLTGIILLALDNPEATGPVNGTAPNPVTSKQFAKALGKALGRPAVNPTPAFALRLLLGEVADVITTGQRVLPKRALALGYQFQYPTIEEAFAEIFKKEPAAA
jgi:uncharacterized protein (TIGR01777 family)